MRRRSRRQIRNRRIIAAIILVACCVILIGIGGAVVSHFTSHDEAKKTAKSEVKETTITIGNAGDIIIHSPFYRSSAYKKDGDYDFTECFSNIKDVYGEGDFSIIDIETCLAGKDAGYSGYPMFKSPDSLVDSLASSGIDMILLANNHIYDYGKEGFLRTTQVMKDKGMLYTGARHSEEEKRYVVQDINGIKVGMINYVYETPRSDDKKGLNGLVLDDEVAPLLNSFDPNDKESFYKDIEEQLSAMKEDGAEFLIVYPHWGIEYQTTEASWQREIAQKLCDMGVDAIIGGHPHVIQPVDVFTSEDGNHKTFCAFSLGNQLSNQRREMMRLKTGNTEDGLFIDLEITKDKTGKVSLTGVKYVPTWVYKNASGPTYSIIPVDEPDTVEDKTGIKGINDDAKASYERTYKIIGDGVNKVKEAYGF